MHRFFWLTTFMIIGFFILGFFNLSSLSGGNPLLGLGLTAVELAAIIVLLERLTKKKIS